ncbi:midasin [Naegleria gruberi]|uniref:Midasin n=1 Tax=Naegleria gruberi TaxID=5762 RepID=D2V7W7_NAEGR|nr:midasin [Naegleria gruberi]EFC46939.1 midasin [Naegleria gruberi]|eukprot:XP_002679683.1 midasin [Naegleria gruberi]
MLKQSSLSAPNQEKTAFSYSHILVVLAKEFPSLEKEVTTFQKKISNSSDTDQYIIKGIQTYLISLFIKQEYTYTIARICKPILPLLVAQVMDKLNNNNNTTDSNYDTINAITKILPLYPQFKTFIKQYFKDRPSLIESIVNNHQEDKIDQKQLITLLEITLRLLIFAPSDFCKMWNWSPFFSLLKHKNKDIKSLTSKCVSIILKLDDQFFNSKIDNLKTYVLEEIESEELVHLENTLSFYDDTETSNMETTTEETRDKLIISHKSDSMVNVCGVWLHKNLREIKSSQQNISADKTKLIFTKTSLENMRSLALGVAQENPIILEGIIGSGKTAYVEELARITGNTDLIKVNLDESFDSKDLLGTYVCTDVPGEFRWQPGALTKAVMEGRWILIEDLDLAPFDIISSIIPLVESGNLFLPSRDEIIPASTGFQLFATQSLVESLNGTTTRQRVLPMSNLWTKVRVNKLPSKEIEHILKVKFESIQQLIPKFIETYDALRSGHISDDSEKSEKQSSESTQLKSFGRLFSFRDLLKWCERVQRFYGQKIQKNQNYVLSQIKRDIFHEAIDVFCGMIAKHDIYDSVVGTLALVWEIYNYEEYLKTYKPQLHEEKGVITVGRISLERDEKNLGELLNKNSNFAHTKQSLRMMERVGAYSADFIGGYKPVDLKILAASVKSNFEQLFSVTFPSKENEVTLKKVRDLYTKKSWAQFIMMLNKIIDLADQKLSKVDEVVDEKLEEVDSKKRKKTQGSSSGTKKQKTSDKTSTLKQYWTKFKESVDKFNQQQILVQNSFAFSFVEGTLVKALKEGHWILLDEINLASTETLERLSSLLEGEEGTLFITEKGDTEPIKRHPNFRIFACMNPPTDIGKKNLPPGLRNRFSEFYVHELTDKDDLKIVVSRYLSTVPHPPVDDIVNFYLDVKKKSEAELSDGASQRPHYSLRTLTRSLDYAVFVMKDYGMERSLYEGFSMGFLTLLSSACSSTVEKMIRTCFFKQKNVDNSLKQAPSQPASGDFVLFKHFWLPQGQFAPEQPADFIITDTVEENLKNLARAIKTNKYPVLLQGPTSAGKTSMVQYLAKMTGHKFVRINNHESTDLQEYFGSYITNSQGKLVFQEGILVEAVRNGYWLVLDELNLAPSDILEALNRLLDDNRELFIPETQETVKPHPHFQLFATQNPPGLYGGRKVLSRAFRNRFLELHIDEIPRGELVTILHRRCQISNQHAEKLVSVMRELQQRRQSSKIFAGKSNITPRDLFRWAERMKGADEKINYNQNAAEEGFMLLAERLRRDEEKDIVKEILEKVFKTKLDLERMYNPKELDNLQVAGSTIVWTKTMKRMYVLVGKCLQFSEPALLVGDTGTGKTTVCQVYADIYEQHLRILNCHQHTETSDILGSLRPVRGREKLKIELEELIEEFITTANTKYSLDINFGNETSIGKKVKRLEDICKKLAKERKLAEPQKKKQKNEFKEKELLEKQLIIRDIYQKWKALFTWYDGPLVQSMKSGEIFLIDEISLAEDAVLERLNSVLEPSRELTLPERGSEKIESIVAHDKFRILATMNPGGDFGKRELSPALRNRFTEIYVPSLSVSEDLAIIVASKLDQSIKSFNTRMVEFVQFFKSKRTKRLLSVRDVISWVQFMNMAVAKLDMDAYGAFLHGVDTVILESIGVGTDSSAKNRLLLRKECFTFLLDKIAQENVLSTEQLEYYRDVFLNENYTAIRSNKTKESSEYFGYHPFYVKCGESSERKIVYALDAPTTGRNVMKVLRAMQLRKPLLLEGSPGVGKTSLISAIAKASGHNIVRINLSEQTDMMDLLGTDLPVEGSSGGQFRWCDGIFLRALRNGDWVLLDELNLASQSVLEGLNSVLDHRAEIYIPEINETVKCPEGFRIFACQNPLQQGGGRKGLPKSFLNRFTQVYVDELRPEDLTFILNSIHGDIGEENIKLMIDFNRKMHKETMELYRFGRKGSPWEFNLRDVFRWCELLKKERELNKDCTKPIDPMRMIDCMYKQRMRTVEDRKHVERVYKELTGKDFPCETNPTYTITPGAVQIGSSILLKNSSFDDSDKDNHAPSTSSQDLILLQSFLNPLENIMKCIEMNYLTIVNGPSACGKTSIVRLIAQMTGNMLSEFSMSSSTDTVELLGGFEQVDPIQKVRKIASFIKIKIDELARIAFLNDENLRFDALKLLYNQWTTYDATAKKDASFSGIEQLKSMCETLFDNLEYQSDEKQAIIQQLDNLSKLLEMGVKGRFEWNDGVLIRSLEAGNWILIDNVNFCNPTVLDRLNSLLEPEGVLVVNERGLVDGEIRIVKPHPHFRIFMVMDPKYGEISRAMRNRGIEISMFPITIPSQDAFTLLANNGVPSAHLCNVLMDYHAKFTQKIFLPEEDRPTIRDLLRCAEVFNSEVKQGLNITNAFKAAISCVYIRSRCSSKSAVDIAESELEECAKQLPRNDHGFPSTFVAANAFKCDKSLFRTVFRQSARLYDIIRNYLSLKVAESNDHNDSTKKLLDSLKWKILVTDLPPHFLQTNDVEKTIISADVMDTSSTSNLINDMQYALEYFIDVSSFKDIDIRVIWLQRLLTLCKSDKILEELLTKGIELLNTRKGCEVSKKIQKIFKNMQQTVTQRFSEIIASQPMNLKYSEQLFARLQYLGLINEQDNYVFDAATILTSQQKRKYEEQQSIAVEFQGTIVENKSSLLHQSYYYHLNPKHRSTAPNRVVVHLYTLFVQIDELVDAIMNSKVDESVCSLDDISGMLRCRDKLWFYLSHTAELSEEFFIYWNWLAKEFLKVKVKKPATSGKKKNISETPYGLYEQLCTFMGEIDGLVISNFNSVGKKNTLYKNCGKPTISLSVELKEIEDTITNYLSVNTSSNTESKELKQLVYNAMSTVKLLQQEPNHPDQEKLLQYVRTVPELLEKAKPKEQEISEDVYTPYKELATKSEQELVMDKIFRDIAEFTAPDKKHINAASLHSTQAISPLFDYKSMHHEMNVVTLLSKIGYILKRLDASSDVKEIKRLLSTAVAKGRHLIDFILQNCSRGPLDLVPYQLLLWRISNLETNSADEIKKIALGIPSLLHFVWIYWNERVWENTYNTSMFENSDSTETPVSRDDLAGPNRLFQDVNSVHILKLLSGWENIPIRSRHIKIDQLKKVVQFICTNVDNVQSEEVDWNNLVYLYCDTLLSFKKSFPEASFQLLLDITDSLCATKQASVQDLTKIIESSNDGRLKAKKNDIISVCNLICTRDEDKNKDLMNRGLAWLKLGETRMNLFIPANSLDPTLKYAIYDKHLKEDIQVLQGKLEIMTSIERFISGSGRNIISDKIEKDITNIQSIVDKITPKVINRPTNISFIDMYREMKSLADQHEVIKNLSNSLIKFFESDNDDKQDMVAELINKEESYQANSHSHIKSKILKNSFGFEDLALPFASSAYHIKYGLRLLCYGSLAKKDESEQNTVNQILNHLLSFPSCNSVQTIEDDLAIVQQWLKSIENSANTQSKCKQYETATKVLRVLMSRCLLITVSQTSSQDNTIHNLQLLNQVFVMYSNLFESVEDELEKKKAEEDNFYKYKERKTTIETEEEILEEEMETMFPTYSEDYSQFNAPTEEKNIMNLSEKKESLISEKSLLERVNKVIHDEREIDYLVRTHKDIFSFISSSSQLRPVDTIDTIRNKMFDESFNVAVHIINTLNGKYQIDMTSSGYLPLVLFGSRALNNLWVKVDNSKEAKLKAYSEVYTEPNIPEITLAFSTLFSMLQRLNFLIKKYSTEEQKGHPILVEMVKIIEHILNQPITSPIIKILTGLELVLIKAGEWEEYLTAHVNSLKDEIRKLSGLIIRWRRMELENWKGIYDLKNREYKNKSINWWFRFYNMICNSSFKMEELTKIIEDFFGICDDFIRTSTIGDFEYRLGLLNNFYQHLAAEIERKYSDDVEVRTKIRDIIFNLHKYYSQFSGKLEERLDQEKQPLETKLRDFITLTKWEDVNIDAIRFTTKKSRRALAKFSKGFGEVLVKPARDLWDKYDELAAASEIIQESEKKPKRKSKNKKIKKRKNKKFIADEPDDIIQQTMNRGKNLIKSHEFKNCLSYTKKEKELLSVIEKEFMEDSKNVVDRLPVIYELVGKNFENLIIKSAVPKEFDAVTSNIEDFSVEIIEQTQLLNKENSPKSMKLRALVTLLTELKEMGISYLKKSVGSETAIDKIFQIPDVGFSLNNLTSNDVQEVFKKADDYYFKNIFSVQNFKLTFEGEVSGDIKSQQTKMRGYPDNLFFLTMKHRRILGTIEASQKANKSFLSTLKHLKQSFENEKDEGVIISQSKARELLNVQSGYVFRLYELVAQITSLYTALSKHDSAYDKPLKTIEDAKSIIDRSVDLLERIMNRTQLFSTKDLKELSENLETLQNARGILNKFVSETSDLPKSKELISLVEEFDQVKTTYESIVAEEASNNKFDLASISSFAKLYKHAVKSIQLTIQDLVKACSEEQVQYEETMKSASEELKNRKKEDDEEDDTYSASYLSKNNSIQRLEEFIDRCHGVITTGLAKINKDISGMIEFIVDNSKNSQNITNSLTELLSNLAPLLQRLDGVVDTLKIPLVYYHKSISKLTYVLLNIFSTLCKQGFCGKDDEEQGEGESDGVDFSSGTGMDDGEGINDIGDQIDNEDQLLNEKDKQQQEGNKDLEKNDNAIEMDGDFEAEKQEVDEQEDDEEQDQDEEQDENKEMGEIDEDDPNKEQLDEKLWDENENDRDDKTEEGSDKNDNPQQQDSELQAQENENDDHQQDNRKDKQKKDDKPMEYEEDEEAVEQEEFEDNMDDKFNDEFQDQDKDGEDQDGKDNDQQMDDLEISEDEQEGDEENQNEQEGDEENKDGEDKEEGDNEDADGDEDLKKKKDEEIDEQVDTEDIAPEDQNISGQDEDNQDAIDPNLESENKQEKDEDGNDDEDGEKENEQEEEEKAHTAEEEADSKDLKETPFGVKQTAGKASDIKEDSAENEQRQEKKNNNAEESGKDTNKNEMGESMDQGTDNNADQEPESGQMQMDPNPLRSLGDAMKNWKKKLNLVERNKQENEKNKQDEGEKSEAFEFVEENDADKDQQENQILSNATEEQSKEFPAMEDGEEDDEDEEMTEEKKKDEFGEEKKKDEKEGNNADSKPSISSKLDKKLEQDEDEDEDMEDIQFEPSNKKVDFVQTNFESTIHTKTEALEEEIETEEPEIKPLSMDDIKMMREELESSLNEWRNNEENVNNSKEIWKKFDILTSSLSQELCEQLRLILEPTLATKLKGDYKTGKRINMKKIIPYIASQFRKDKIWLRRTKPNKRDYQILLAIDDSKSMNDNHAGQMACEALTLISRAMSQLEVGQLGVVSFGEKMKLLHPFEKPFTDETGAEILSQFTFKQNQTQIVNFLSDTIQLMENYKSMEFSNNSEQYQLAFIISDGRMLERDRIVKLVREGQEKKILFVFILIDNPNPKDSILNVKSINSTSDPKQPLTFSYYIEKFPFPFYIILRDIQTLPEVLADALRQYFELINLTANEQV